VVSIAAQRLDDFATLTVDAPYDNMCAKFYGQADLVLTGQHYNSAASFTLTSGPSSTSPGRGSPAAA
jgi:hypothetical protein